MRNASMKVLKNLVCCAAFICLMFVLAMPAHAASKADELLQLVNAERAQAGVAPLSMGSSALNAAAQARAKELTVNYSYNRPNGSREFTILPEYGVDDVSVGENYWAAAEDASDVVAAWNRYDFFKERMLDKDATSVGIGYYEGGEYGNYWVMIFTYARGTSENGFAQEVLALVNAERAKENLAPLAMGDAKLQAAADERAKEVAKVASHTRPDGTNCFTVLKEYGVSDTATGENAAWGETTPEKSLQTGWLRKATVSISWTPPPSICALATTTMPILSGATTGSRSSQSKRMTSIERCTMK